MPRPAMQTGLIWLSSSAEKDYTGCFIGLVPGSAVDNSADILSLITISGLYDPVHWGLVPKWNGSAVDKPAEYRRSQLQSHYCSVTVISPSSWVKLFCILDIVNYVDKHAGGLSLITITVLLVYDSLTISQYHVAHFLNEIVLQWTLSTL